MATQITIAIQNDTLGQVVTNTFTLDDNDQFVQAYLAMLTAKVNRANDRGMPNDPKQPPPTMMDALNQIAVLCWGMLQQTANQYYTTQAQQQAVQMIVPITAQQDTSTETTSGPIPRPLSLR